LVDDLDARIIDAGYRPEDAMMITNSQDRVPIVEHFGDAGKREHIDTFRTLWVITRDGDYEALWGSYSLPYKNAMIWRIKWQFVGEKEWNWLRRQFVMPCATCGGLAIDHRRRRLDLTLEIDKVYRREHPKADFVPVCMIHR